ncbi:MAG: hypothetical protein MJ219_03000 [Mycoplasmoidaceae bacterium]|nr:hypothetical protein [Mycoplasmoidaceae bacterium]
MTTLQMMAGDFPIETLFASKALAVSFMVFILYYIPCIPSINTLRSEVGHKYTLINIGVSFATAYVLSTILY